MNILTAKIAPVKLGTFVLQGLMFEDGEFGISIPQVNDLVEFSPSNNTASRDLKRLLGASFSPSKVKVTGIKQTLNAIPLIDFETLLFDLALSGNKRSVDICRSLIGLSLHQLFCDAFDVEFDKEDRQELLVKRLKGKITRRKFTDAIKDYISTHSVSDNYKKFVYANVSDKLNKSLFGKTAKQLR